MKFRIFALTLLILMTAFAAFSQTTEFSFQGSLRDGASAANGNYDFEFRLYDALTAEIRVKTAGGPSYNTLAPRQKISGVFL